jgi:hypothetical protein
VEAESEARLAAAAAAQRIDKLTDDVRHPC